MFLGSNFSMVPSVILPEETGCQKTKMAAAETGSTYNSASRLDRNAILAATPMFSGSSNSMGLLRTLPDTSGSRKSKMAATETGSTYNSASRLDRNAISTATSMFSGYSNPNLMIRILSDTRGTGQSKMAAAETGSTYNSAFTIDRNAISKATPMFSGSSNSMGLLRTLPDTSGSRKSKMAATETGSTYNSASRLDRNAVSTATPMFSGPSNPNLMIRILSDTRGTGQSNMAAAKPEVLFTVWYITQINDLLKFELSKNTHKR
jgi:hypothetical protein